MNAWKVIDETGTVIDTVFYDSDCSAEYVYRGLVNHDGYDPGITVEKQRKSLKQPEESYPKQ